MGCPPLRSCAGCGSCTNLSDGFSRIEILANGNLQVCSNVGGNCNCTEFAGNNISVLTDNTAIDGTFDHDDGNGNVITVDICAALPFCTIGELGNVANAADAANDNEILQFNIITGEYEPVDICVAIQDCTIGNLANVDAATADNANNLDLLVWNGLTNMWEATNLHTDTLVDNTLVDGTFRHTALDGVIVDVDICAALPFCTIGEIGNVNIAADTAAEDNVLVYNAVTMEWEPGDVTYDCEVTSFDPAFFITELTPLDTTIVVGGGHTFTMASPGNASLQFNYDLRALTAYTGIAGIQVGWRLNGGGDNFFGTFNTFANVNLNTEKNHTSVAELNGLAAGVHTIDIIYQLRNFASNIIPGELLFWNQSQVETCWVDRV